MYVILLKHPYRLYVVAKRSSKSEKLIKRSSYLKLRAMTVGVKAAIFIIFIRIVPRRVRSQTAVLYDRPGLRPTQVAPTIGIEGSDGNLRQRIDQAAKESKFDIPLYHLQSFRLASCRVGTTVRPSRPATTFAR